MHRPSTSITFSMPAKDHRAYIDAISILRRFMGHRAPDAQTLVLHNVCGRDAAGLADEYLDSIDWARTAGRTVWLRRRKAGPGGPKAGVKAPARSGRKPQRCSLDPSRN